MSHDSKEGDRTEKKGGNLREETPLPVDRRTVLSSIGAGAGTPFLGKPAVASEKSTSTGWECYSDCPTTDIVVEEVGLPDGIDYEREGTCAIHWYESWWSDDANSWKHTFSVSGGAASTDHPILGGEIYGQYYRMETSEGDLRVEVVEKDESVMDEPRSERFRRSVDRRNK